MTHPNASALRPAVTATVPAEPVSPYRGLLASLWYNRRTLVRLALAAGIAAVTINFLMPKEWTATGSFVVQEPKADAAGGLAGLTSKFGIDLSSSSGGYSPRFFAWLLLSDQVLTTIADMRIKPPAEDAGKTVTEALEIKGKTPEIRRARAV